MKHLCEASLLPCLYKKEEKERAEEHGVSTSEIEDLVVLNSRVGKF